MSQEIVPWFITVLSLLLWMITFFYFRKSRVSARMALNKMSSYSKTSGSQSEKEVTQDSIIYFASSLFRQNTIEDILWDICINCVDKLDFVDCVFGKVNDEICELSDISDWGQYVIIDD